MNRISPRQTAVAVERVRDALPPAGLDARTDADLLDRFARYADHPAFEVLLRRHGPMVLGICRRTLSNPADVEDAFQATFLVLVRKARSVRSGDRLGPWLYGVAYKVAAKARGRAARSAVRTEATDMLPDPASPPDVPDWLPVLDAELNALPAKYREPLVLCELQGATRAEAAKALGVPEGTLSSRLARGREMLRRRLLKYGTLLPAGGLAALFAAHGVGRAAVPLGLFARTAESAAVASAGAALAGAVPAGAARLTDEVLKGMMLTKLKLTGAALLALGLLAAGAFAAWAEGEPAEPQKPKRVTKAADAKPQPTPAKSAGPKAAVPDRDALQGLWVLDKCDATKGVGADGRREMKEMIGKMRFLVAGDVWWGMIDGPGGNVFPQVARLDPGKNPKWLDLQSVAPHGFAMEKCTYELLGERLRLCAAFSGEGPRPAEFNPDDDAHLLMLEFRLEKLPPAAGEKALVGSWSGGEYEPGRRPVPARVEILDGFLFARLPKTGDWIGGKYTVDVTKNPKWIDVELVAPFEDDNVTKMYGCYEVSDGQLRMALGAKRATRPLEFTDAEGVMVFDLKPTKEPLAPGPTAADFAVPALEGANRPKAPAPRPKAEPDAVEEVRGLIKAGEFAEAERRLRKELPGWNGLRRAEGDLMLGVALLERAKNAGKDAATKLYEEAITLFRLVYDANAVPADGKHAAWVRSQAGLRVLQALHKTQKPDELLRAAEPFLEKHRGTVEELIILSLVYHAHKQKGESGKAFETRDRMKAVFERLPTSAFTEETGEHSRAYWEKVWFAEGK